MTDKLQVAIELAENCGYAIATMESLFTEKGADKLAIKDAIKRLQESQDSIIAFAESK